MHGASPALFEVIAVREASAETCQIGTILGSDGQHTDGPRIQDGVRDSFTATADRAVQHGSMHCCSDQPGGDAQAYRRGKETTSRGVEVAGFQERFEQFFVCGRCYRWPKSLRRQLQQV